MNSKKKKGSATVQGPLRRTQRMRVTTLRGPADRIATIVWEEQGPNLRKSRRKSLGGLLGTLLSVGHPNAHVHDPFWVPSVARQSQVVGGVLKAQVVGGVAKVGRGLDRDLKRKRTRVKILPT